MRLSIFEIDEYINAIKGASGTYDNIGQTMDLSKKKVLLFNLPVDSNLGDHAQTMCIVKWINQYFPEYELYCFPVILAADERTLDNIISRIKLRTTCDDIIIMHSGYHVNDIYVSRYGNTSPTTMLQIACLKNFHDNRIIFFPQTINIQERNLQEYASLINKCNSVFFMCRDDVSYDIAKKYFVKSNISIKPDIVTCLIKNHENKRTGDTKEIEKVYVALRNPEHAESIITKEQKNAIYNFLKEKKYHYSIGNTSVNENYKEIIAAREKIVQDKINEISQYDLVITDLYHGTIFSLVAETFVVVLKSKDHKISSGVNLLKQLPDWEDRLYYCENHEQLMSFLHTFKNINKKARDEKSLFKSMYYDGLKGELEEFWSYGGVE